MGLKILVAIDLSDASEKVVAAAKYLAKATHAEVRVLHVAEAEPDFVGYDGGPDVVRDQVAKEFRDEHRAVQAVAESLRDAGISAKALLIQGPIVDTVLAEAKRFEANLLVVGSHGFGALYDIFVGSSSRGILKSTELPVLVVPVRE